MYNLTVYITFYYGSKILSLHAPKYCKVNFTLAASSGAGTDLTAKFGAAPSQTNKHIIKSCNYIKTVFYVTQGKLMTPSHYVHNTIISMNLKRFKSVKDTRTNEFCWHGFLACKIWANIMNRSIVFNLSLERTLFGALHSPKASVKLGNDFQTLQTFRSPLPDKWGNSCITAVQLILSMEYT